MKPRLRGEAHEIRFADDAVLCFQYKEDAERVMEVLPKRFAKYGLTIHPEKTRLVEFGRHAEANAKRQGKKPCTLDFLGFTHICARSRKGKFTVHVRTMKKRFRRSLTAIAEWCQENRHMPVDMRWKKRSPSATRSVIKLSRESSERLALGKNRDMGCQDRTGSVRLKSIYCQPGCFLGLRNARKPNK